MKQIVRKIYKVTLMVIASLSFILMCAETTDGGICLPWNLGCLAALVVSSRLLDKMGALKKEE